MNVDQLIEKLSALPEEVRQRTVWVEGCDCANRATGEISLQADPYPPNEPTVLVHCER